MKIVLLGTNGYHPNDRRHTACLLLPEVGVVLDAGTAMFRLRDRLATDELDIFISHAHLDHVVGLTYLLGILRTREMQRVVVHAAADKLEAIQQHLFSALLFPILPDVEFRALEGSVALSDGGELTHFPLEHAGGVLGFRLNWPGHSLAYVTDTTAAIGADYVEKIRGVDLLVHECNFPDAKREFAKLTCHSFTTAVAEVAQTAEVGRLVLVHFDPANTSDDPVGLLAARSLFPNTDLGEDELEIEF